MLTWVFDSVGMGIDATAYPRDFYQSLLRHEFFARGISFSNEWTMFDRVRLGTNSPLWSLSYEAAYYSLFGTSMFTTGVLRLVLIGTAILVFGINALLLMPAWLMGVVLWHWIRDGKADHLSKHIAFAFAFGAPLAYVACHFLYVPETRSA